MSDWHVLQKSGFRQGEGYLWWGSYVTRAEAEAEAAEQNRQQQSAERGPNWDPGGMAGGRTVRYAVVTDDELNAMIRRGAIG